MGTNPTSYLNTSLRPNKPQIKLKNEEMGEVAAALVLRWHAKDLKACKQYKHNMLRAKNIKASKEHHTRGVQYIA